MPFEKEIDGVLYRLYEDSERYDAVYEYVEENLQYFNVDFLESVIDEDALEEIHREFAKNYVDSIKWESEHYKTNRLKEEMEEWGVETEEEFIEALFRNSFYECGAFRYLCDHFGVEEAIEMALRAGAIDFDEVTEKAIAADGYGHFLGDYDGKEYVFEIDGTTYYGYRIE